MRKLIRRRSVMERVPFSKASLYRLIKLGQFPKPYPLDEKGRSVAWLEEEVDAWIEQKIAAGSAGANREEARPAA